RYYSATSRSDATTYVDHAYLHLTPRARAEGTPVGEARRGAVRIGPRAGGGWGRGTRLPVLMAQVSGSRAARSRAAAGVRRTGGWRSRRGRSRGAGSHPGDQREPAVESCVHLDAGVTALPIGARRARGRGAGAPGQASAAG